MPVVRLAVAACLLLLTACGAGHAADDPTARQSVGAPDPTVAAERSDLSSSGERVTSLGEGVTLSVSEPTSFTPTATAYPRAERAVAFDLVIDNGSDTVYRPAQLSFVATADGVTVDQVIDSTQGYPGVVGAIEEVRPDKSLRFAIAFEVPAKPCTVRVAVRAASSAASAIPIFDGTV